MEIDVAKGKFDWIYDIEPLRWNAHDGKKHLKVELTDLLSKSGLEPGSDWQAEFNVWAVAQQLEFRALPMINVVAGEVLAVAIVQLHVDEHEHG
ncbi:hypothetical protein [uncultured Stenotrophomonas sp.]|uniref:hypothetical protein n=1 Tax=uncultured Stenotrophomonas sp. TaxID=165438 RepID=UPI0025D8CF18|nr:hypothetical protein [uncultured Stenotrophomonas sp.]